MRLSQTRPRSTRRSLMKTVTSSTSHSVASTWKTLTSLTLISMTRPDLRVSTPRRDSPNFERSGSKTVKVNLSVTLRCTLPSRVSSLRKCCLSRSEKVSNPNSSVPKSLVGVLLFAPTRITRSLSLRSSGGCSRSRSTPTSATRPSPLLLKRKWRSSSGVLFGVPTLSWTCPLVSTFTKLASGLCETLRFRLERSPFTRPSKRSTVSPKT
mmetsp:Transcript_104637/g.293243  ORF Transcript_104637/g.293243 Transcript_104637/m.293243 type:complete len:210 (-) Transcript_104637:1211-1840(-)